MITPFNLCNLPPWAIASRNFNRHPQVLEIQGVRHNHQRLFAALDRIDARSRAGAKMAAAFDLPGKEERTAALDAVEAVHQPQHGAPRHGVPEEQVAPAVGVTLSYILVRMELNNETWHVVKDTPKVTGFVGGTATKPTPISEKEVQNILHQIQEGVEKPRPKFSFMAGEQVRVIDGPFQDFNGTVEDVNYEKNRLRVAVTIFGRATPVELGPLRVALDAHDEPPVGRDRRAERRGVVHARLLLDLPARRRARRCRSVAGARERHGDVVARLARHRSRSPAKPRAHFAVDAFGTGLVSR